MKYGTVADSVGDEARRRYAKELEGAWIFGFTTLDTAFEQKLHADNPGLSLSAEHGDGAALAYTHIKQMVKTLHSCGKDASCIRRTMDASPADSAISFQRFENRTAVLDMRLERLT